MLDRRDAEIWSAENDYESSAEYQRTKERVRAEANKPARYLGNCDGCGAQVVRKGSVNGEQFCSKECKVAHTVDAWEVGRRVEIPVKQLDGSHSVEYFIQDIEVDKNGDEWPVWRRDIDT